MNRTRHLGIALVGIFAIIAGLGEIIVGLTGNFLGILSAPLAPSLSTAIVGAFYSLGGLSFLTMRKWSAALGIAFVAAEILGGGYLVASGCRRDRRFQDCYRRDHCARHYRLCGVTMG